MSRLTPFACFPNSYLVISAEHESGVRGHGRFDILAAVYLFIHKAYTVAHKARYPIIFIYSRDITEIPTINSFNSIDKVNSFLYK